MIRFYPGRNPGAHLFFLVAALIILFLALPITVAAEDRVMVNYTLIDENSVSLRDFTAVHESHFGLSKGMVAYHKGQTIYTWNSRTGERGTLEIPRRQIIIQRYNLSILQTEKCIMCSIKTR